LIVTCFLANRFEPKHFKSQPFREVFIEDRHKDIPSFVLGGAETYQPVTLNIEKRKTVTLNIRETTSYRVTESGLPSTGCPSE
jgi:hypothetical protein